MRDVPQAVMLFAAGFGTRMGALTAKRPKPLIPVAGQALIDHTLNLVEAISPKTIVVNTHYKADLIQAHFDGSDVILSHETPDILETGGGVKQAAPLLAADTVFTSNTDAIWLGANPFKELTAAWKPDKMDALLMCVRPEDAEGHKGDGDFTMHSGALTRGAGYVFGGVQIIKLAALDDIEDRVFSLNLVWDKLIERGRLFGAVHDGGWLDVGHPESIPLAETTLEQGHV